MQAPAESKAESKASPKGAKGKKRGRAEVVEEEAAVAEAEVAAIEVSLPAELRNGEHEPSSLDDDVSSIRRQAPSNLLPYMADGSIEPSRAPPLATGSIADETTPPAAASTSLTPDELVHVWAEELLITNMSDELAARIVERYVHLTAADVEALVRAGAKSAGAQMDSDATSAVVTSKGGLFSTRLLPTQ